MSLSPAIALLLTASVVGPSSGQLDGLVRDDAAEAGGPWLFGNDGGGDGRRHRLVQHRSAARRIVEEEEGSPGPSTIGPRRLKELTKKEKKERKRAERDGGGGGGDAADSTNSTEEAPTGEEAVPESEKAGSTDSNVTADAANFTSVEDLFSDAVVEFLTEEDVASLSKREKKALDRQIEAGRSAEFDSLTAKEKKSLVANNWANNWRGSGMGGGSANNWGGSGMGGGSANNWGGSGMGGGLANNWEGSGVGGGMGGGGGGMWHDPFSEDPWGMPPQGKEEEKPEPKCFCGEWEQMGGDEWSSGGNEWSSGGNGWSSGGNSWSSGGDSSSSGGNGWSSGGDSSSSGGNGWSSSNSSGGGNGWSGSNGASSGWSGSGNKRSTTPKWSGGGGGWSGGRKLSAKDRDVFQRKTLQRKTRRDDNLGGGTKKWKCLRWKCLPPTWGSPPASEWGSPPAPKWGSPPAHAGWGGPPGANQEETPKPTKTPTDRPTHKPTNKPTNRPTHRPTDKPTKTPTGSPTSAPTSSPTISCRCKDFNTGKDINPGEFYVHEKKEVDAPNVIVRTGVDERFGKHAFDLTRFHVDKFEVQQHATVHVRGTLLVYANTIRINGNIIGNGDYKEKTGGYDGAICIGGDGVDGEDPQCDLDKNGACMSTVGSPFPETIDGKGKGGLLKPIKHKDEEEDSKKNETKKEQVKQVPTCIVGGGGGAGHGKEGGNGGGGEDLGGGDDDNDLKDKKDKDKSTPAPVPGSGGAGGKSYDTDSFDLLLPGSGGGGGAECNGDTSGGHGGEGGAAILFFARRIYINGDIQLNGSGGISGKMKDVKMTDAAHMAKAGGGGGSGGALTLTACTVEFGREGKVEVNGGKGGDGFVGKDLNDKQTGLNDGDKLSGAGGGGGGGPGVIRIAAEVDTFQSKVSMKGGPGGAAAGIGEAGENAGTGKPVFHRCKKAE